MLSLEQCKTFLQGYDLTDAEVEQLRDSLYSVVNEVLDEYARDRNKN